MKLHALTRLDHMGCSISKVDSRFRGNDNIDGVIPAKAGIQDESGWKYFKIFKNHASDPASHGRGILTNLYYRLHLSSSSLLCSLSETLHPRAHAHGFFTTIKIALNDQPADGPVGFYPLAFHRFLRVNNAFGYNSFNIFEELLINFFIGRKVRHKKFIAEFRTAGVKKIVKLRQAHNALIG